MIKSQSMQELSDYVIKFHNTSVSKPIFKINYFAFVWQVLILYAFGDSICIPNLVLSYILYTTKYRDFFILNKLYLFDVEQTLYKIVMSSFFTPFRPVFDSL
jgi:hypothetical protein